MFLISVISVIGTALGVLVISTAWHFFWRSQDRRVGKLDHEDEVRRNIDS
jgi:hypothetical protein